MAVAAILDLCTNKISKEQNSGKNDFSMPITFRKVVLHIFFWHKKQNGRQKGNFEKKLKHIKRPQPKRICGQVAFTPHKISFALRDPTTVV